MGARPVPAPLLVRPRCGLRAIAQRAVPARLRAHVIARVVGIGVVVGDGRLHPQVLTFAYTTELNYALLVADSLVFEN